MATCSIVGLNSDASVRRNKGPERPITLELERAEVLARARMRRRGFDLRRGDAGAKSSAASSRTSSSRAPTGRRIEIVGSRHGGSSAAVGSSASPSSRAIRRARSSSGPALQPDARAGSPRNFRRLGSSVAGGRPRGHHDLLHLYVADASGSAQDGFRPPRAWSARPGRQRARPPRRRRCLRQPPQAGRRRC